MGLQIFCTNCTNVQLFQQLSGDFFSQMMSYYWFLTCSILNKQHQMNLSHFVDHLLSLSYHFD